MSRLLDRLPPELGLRAALLEAGVLSPTQIHALLNELRIDPMCTVAELSDELRSQLEAHTQQLVQGELTTTTLWKAPLDRVRAIVYHYATQHRVLEWDPERPKDGLARWVFGFLSESPVPAETRRTLAALEEKLENRPDYGHDVGEFYEEIVYLFALSPLEEELLWLFLAPALEPQFQWLYDALSRTVSMGALPLRLALQMAQSAQLASDEALMTALQPSGVLRRLALIEPTPSADVFRAAPRLVAALLSQQRGEQDESLAGLLRISEAQSLRSNAEDEEDAALRPDELIAAVGRELPSRLRKLLRQKRNRILVLGPKGSGAQTLAHVIAGIHSLRLATIDLEALLSTQDFQWRAVLREATLQRAMLLFTNIDALVKSEKPLLARERLLTILAQLSTPMVLDAGSSLSSDQVFQLVHALDAVTLRLGLPDREQRETLWRWALSAPADNTVAVNLRHPKLGAKDIERLIEEVRTFPLGADQIADGVRLGRVFTLQDHPDETGIEVRALKRACQSLLGHRLGQVATRVESKHAWEDLIVPESVKEQIDELIAYGRLSRKVLDDWGFGKSLSYGKGLTALFSGASGTGKTMVAGLIARELGMDLYRVDLSRMVSKYIGETEKQLAMLFDEARASGCALLFDEADSLFGKRTEVQSSTDRYANLEVNFLLQQVEEHPGMVLLTSNFPKSIDEAFMRRLRFRIEFPRPEAPEREHMWQRMISTQAPQEDDLQLARLAEHFELSGGEIRNAVLRAALYAASEDRPLCPEDLERSARAEYRQLGRLVPIQRRHNA
ncbi:MAG: ATP-binding protein [Myxococcota bacterium]|nr:ATP-binding protein [Myxococcota bacterium]